MIEGDQTSAPLLKNRCNQYREIEIDSTSRVKLKFRPDLHTWNDSHALSSFTSCGPLFQVLFSGSLHVFDD